MLQKKEETAQPHTNGKTTAPMELDLHADRHRCEGFSYSLTLFTPMCTSLSPVPAGSSSRFANRL